MLPCAVFRGLNGQWLLRGSAAYFLLRHDFLLSITVGPAGVDLGLVFELNLKIGELVVD
jgi:hypothetical protein